MCNIQKNFYSEMRLVGLNKLTYIEKNNKSAAIYEKGLIRFFPSEINKASGKKPAQEFSFSLNILHGRKTNSFYRVQ